MGPLVQRANESLDQPIELRVHDGANGDFTFYEDENDNYNCERGAFATTPIRWNDTQRTLAVEPRNGRVDGMVENRTFEVVFVRPGRGTGVEVNDKPDHIISGSCEVRWES
jgi:alpha-D-xyloside xylohydrolase